MEIYKSREDKFFEESKKIKSKSSQISSLRLGTVLLIFASIYYAVSQNNQLFFLPVIFLVGVFFMLMNWHTRVQIKLQFLLALRDINRDEAAFLDHKVLPFDDGAEFVDHQHSYTHDLDIFGTNSIFHRFNRTATYIGKRILANQFLTLLPPDTIISNQLSVIELVDNLDWRQDFLARAKICNDSKKDYEYLLKWSKYNSEPLSQGLVILSIISSAILVVFGLVYLVMSQLIFAKLLSIVFIFNLGLLGIFMRRIKSELAHSTSIDGIISNYSLLLQMIEAEDFKSPRLLNLKEQLFVDQEKKKASAIIGRLSRLFSNMDSINNVVGTVFFNGTLLYHLHQYNALVKWKRLYAENLENWLSIIGEFEMLLSLSNISYNNPDFAFPEINTNHQINFENLSHPLISVKNRVGNDVDFYQKSFIVLTGSNMSGKSTFLRSLGVNMVLAGMGGVVCASKATFCPMPVLVSMRLSDSLSDSQSYFYAEINRLKQIMTAVENKQSFVLLDEILKGTNSDDKRNGTVEVLKKLINRKAFGILATHDIEVCDTANEFPNVIANKCFEANIVNNDINFDYILRDGVCQNRSATFLMKKIGII